MADAADSKSADENRIGSTPIIPTGSQSLAS